MAFTFLAALALSATLLFVYVSAPLTLGLIIVFQAVLVSTAAAFAAATAWFSFLLAMLFLSAMMIIFIYVSSLASNDVLKPKLALTSLTLGLLLTGTLLTLTNPTDLASDFSLLLSSALTSGLTSATFSVFKVYSPVVSVITLLLVFYLLVCLVVVVKNSTTGSGPLRSNI